MYLQIGRIFFESHNKIIIRGYGMNMFIQRQCKDIIDISKIHFPEQWEYLCRARLYLGQMYLISIASRINAINSYRIQKVKLLIFLISNFWRI